MAIIIQLQVRHSVKDYKQLYSQGYLAWVGIHASLTGGTVMCLLGLVSQMRSYSVTTIKDAECSLTEMVSCHLHEMCSGHPLHKCSAECSDLVDLHFVELQLCIKTLT